MKDIKDMNEKELRETKVEWPKRKEELIEYIDSLVERDHDYGTCVYAMSMAAVAAFYYVSHKLGVTGFQASCADMDILRRTRSLKNGFMLIDYEKLLYPHYLNNEHFPTKESLMEDVGEQLAEAAKKKLEETNGDVHPNVKQHWENIVNLYG